MIQSDNYLMVVCSRELRIACGLAAHDVVFPFASGDDLSLHGALESAGVVKSKIDRHSSRLRAEAVIAVYMPTAELAGIPSILDVDEAREIKSRRVWRRTRPRTPWGYGKDRGIGAGA